MPSSPLISVEAVGKSFGTRVALDGISFEVDGGGITGLLGPNGAGKTTFLRILTTILPADSGDIAVGGISVNADPGAVRAQLGVCPAGPCDLRRPDRPGKRVLLWAPLRPFTPRGPGQR